MTQKRKTMFIWAVLLLLLFGIFTIAVITVDVQPIGPNNSTVGFASINQAFAEAIGVNMTWFDISESLILCVFLTALCFAALGTAQLIQRKQLFAVDRDIIILGIFYIIVIILYVGADLLPINFRPILIDGALNPSYPSSHTFIFLCVMITAIMQIHKRMRKGVSKAVLQTLIIAVTLPAIAGRIISGAHWLTDIIGGILLAASLICFYIAAVAEK